MVQRSQQGKSDSRTCFALATRANSVSRPLQKESKSSADKNKTKKEKVFLEFEGRFPPPSTGERRGGRGSDRGRGAPRNQGDRPGRGAAAPRGGRGGRSAGPAVPDESAFPALGA